MNIRKNIDYSAMFAALDIALEPVASLDARYETVYARLDGLCYEVEDAARDLRDLREDMDYDGEEAERVESRLDLLRRLNRKYGATTQEMIRYRDKIEAELSELEDSDEAAERLEKDYRQMTRRLEEISVKLTHAREEAARRFERAIVEQLHDLGMKNARPCWRSGRSDRWRSANFCCRVLWTCWLISGKRSPQAHSGNMPGPAPGGCSPP